MRKYLKYIRERKPDFQNLLKVLDGQVPDRPTLFEFFLNKQLYELLADEIEKGCNDELRDLRVLISAFRNAGYDYATLPTSYWNSLKFERGDSNAKESRSLNQGFIIIDEASFNNYQWPVPETGNYEIFETLVSFVPDGMKLVPCGPGGILENAIDLVGYENLCFISLMDERLCQKIFDAIGSRLLKYYEIISGYNIVGALIYNDDWGFKTQTMFSPEMLRTYVFPWCERITAAIHAKGKPVILHSCGNLYEIMDDIINKMKFDGKHSFEDNILPVEQAYEKWGDRIAILGGIDLDFLVNSTPEKIKERAANLIEAGNKKGAYALGSGNSIPNYVPVENYFAMLESIME